MQSLDFPMVDMAHSTMSIYFSLERVCMTIEDYRLKLGWSKAKLAREADIDIGTLNDAISGKRVYKATAAKIARALSNGLGYEVTYRDFDGVNFID
jgi:transcriptional regulator with XRE-family HTH domain